MNSGTRLRYSARVSWSEENEAFVAVCPEFEGISALGRTGSKAVSELQEALLLAVEAHEAEGWAIPEPVVESPYSGQFRLRLPRSLHAWLSDRAEREGVSLNTLVLEFLSRARGAAEATDHATELLDTSLRRLESMVLGSDVG